VLSLQDHEESSVQPRRWRSPLIAAIVLCVGCHWATEPEAAIGLVIEPVELNAIVGVASPVAVYLVRADQARVEVPARWATFRSTDESVARVLPDSAGWIVTTGLGSARIGVSLRFNGRVFVTTLPVRVGMVIPAAP
jgi:hypothetical protein